MLRHSRWSYVALGLVVALGATCAAYVALSADAAPEAPFLGANQATMDTMMAGMAVKPSGDADADFAAMTIPHRQDACTCSIAWMAAGRTVAARALDRRYNCRWPSVTILLRDKTTRFAGQFEALYSRPA